MTDRSTIINFDKSNYIQLNLNYLSTFISLTQTQGSLLFNIANERDDDILISSACIAIEADTPADLLRRAGHYKRQSRDALYDLVLSDMIISIGTSLYIINPKYLNITDWNRSKFILKAKQYPDYVYKQLDLESVKTPRNVKVYRDFAVWMGDLRKGPRNVLLCIVDVIQRKGVVIDGVKCVDVGTYRKEIARMCGLRKIDFVESYETLLDLWYLYKVDDQHVAVNPYLIGIIHGRSSILERAAYDRARAKMCREEEMKLSDSAPGEYIESDLEYPAML